MQALYRKYRSRSLAEVVGQEHVTSTLESALKSGRISHAYLFTGPRGVGKTSVARILAHEINQLPYSEQPMLDIIEIDAASNRRIDDIRDLRDKIHIAPVSAKYKVYIIDEVHMLTGESFNALLKTLEEPPAHVVFILATTEVHKLPATIISRTQRYSFRAAKAETLVDHLRHIAKAEKINVSDDALQLIAEHGDGSFRDSISLLDQLANIGGGNIDAKSVEQSIGLAPKNALQSLVQALQAGNTRAVIDTLSELEAHGVTSNSLVPQLLRSLQNEASSDARLYLLIDQLIDVPRAYAPKIKLLTTLVGFTLQHQAPPAKTASVTAQTLKPLVEITAPKGPTIPKKKPSSAKTAKEPAATEISTSNLQELTSDQWSQVLGKIKSTSPPLCGILQHSVPDFDAKTQTLTLKCRYILHSKKIDDPKAKNEIALACQAILGGAPIIKTKYDSSLEQPDTSIPSNEPASPDSASKAVMDLMGGGEIM